MVLAKGLRPSQVVAAILFVRILSVFLVQTWYVPDEYWQTLEVAHKHAFGYGALTWEWQKGIRSYLVPGIVTAVYTVLKYTGLDYPEAVIFLPRILQALLSTAADYSFYKWTGNRKWALFLILTSWFWFYTSGRTLLQTTETALVTIALSVFPFKSGRLGYYEKESNKWLIIAAICTWVRPTSAPLWAVLGAYNIFTTNQGRLRLFVRTYVPIGRVHTKQAASASRGKQRKNYVPHPRQRKVMLGRTRAGRARIYAPQKFAYSFIRHPNWAELGSPAHERMPREAASCLRCLAVGGALVALDSYFHGSLIVTPWEFFRINVLQDIASFYGTHPWHWYLTQGLPAVLGVNLLPLIWAAFTVLRRPKENKTGVLLLAAAAAHVALYSKGCPLCLTSTCFLYYGLLSPSFVARRKTRLGSFCSPPLLLM
ncbi:alg9-like mannosyltransferase family domain-containing protein [Phthorimaea operculella]|nr:alg9-like mannosyltransferase family domain-containing protein [Phthorimaea operculella]